MTNIFDQMASEAEGDFTESERPTEEISLSPAIPHEESSGTSPEIKTCVQELLKQGYVEETNRGELFRLIIIHRQLIADALEPLDLTLRLDTHRGVAFLAVLSRRTESPDVESDSEDDPWSHPLVRKQRLTLEQSLMVAILRQVFVIHEQEFGVGQSPAKVSIDELLPIFLTYSGESGSDSRDENRLLQLLDQLKPHGIVSEVDKKHEVTIRPLIAHLASPESLTGFLNVLKEKVQAIHRDESQEDESC